ncbi:Protein IN2-1-like protein B [Hibiscus syriacus]|uniref:Protein IN2-1-like protein B n=1 Tax=Hibiscus syriacus TaxID=106335 RepID=A0A6A3B364_HIBSY|nr:Protein IN2-1-like protein B [Hibiscus syriacus]
MESVSDVAESIQKNGAEVEDSLTGASQYVQKTKQRMASLKIYGIIAIPTGSSSTSQYSSNHPIPFSSNPIKSALSAFHPILSFHRELHFSILASKKSTTISSAMSSGHGLQDKIKLVPIDMKNRPAWYKERVYPPNKVPALEHNNEVKGESLDLIKYIDTYFEGPSLFPDDPAKRQFADELFSYIDSFYKTVTSTFKGEGIAFDDIEIALSKFEDGPFFLGQFSLVDIAYAPFIERFHHFLMDVKNYDVTHADLN